jgi:predicted pyridoxine 5'-phosphate oxidase superfamily flavin-nucleotide-binding protein
MVTPVSEFHGLRDPGNRNGGVSQEYHQTQRALQDRFDTRRLADRLAETTKAVIGPKQKAFIERRDMFFLASADEDGWPQCSYKGGEPGFVRVLDEETLAFPSYDGNGMYLSAGNLLVNPRVGLLFVDFEVGTRLRLNGLASIDDGDPLIAAYPGAQLVVRVRVREVFSNCRRYVHRYRLVERSRFVPSTEEEPPVPDWKLDEWFADALPAADPARDPARPSAPSIPQF